MNNQIFKVITKNREYVCDIKKLISLTQFFLENKIEFKIIIENENELFQKAFKGAIIYLLSLIEGGGL